MRKCRRDGERQCRNCWITMSEPAELTTLELLNSIREIAAELMAIADELELRMMQEAGSQ